MAGHGPPPKDPALRKRRNKTATRAIVEATATPAAEIKVAHELPVRPCTFCPAPAEPANAKATKKKGRWRKKTVVEQKPQDACKTCGGTGILPWHPWTRDSWAAFWDPAQNPFCGQYLSTEILGSVRALFCLYDAFWRSLERGAIDLDLERAIRLRERALCLDPMARRAAQWEVKRSPGLDPGAASGGPVPPTRPTQQRADLRKVLFMGEAKGRA